MLPTGSSLYQHWMTQKERNATRIYYSALPQGSPPKTAEESLVSVWKEASRGRQGICVIENASPAVVALLRRVWNVEEEFFVEHATNSDVSGLWQPLWKQPKTLSQAKWQTLEGIYEYHGMTLSIDTLKPHSISYCERHLFQDGNWPVNSTTRLSYIRVLPSLYLFLVDPPIPPKGALREIKTYKAKTTLRFPYSKNRGGVLLPPRPGAEICNLFDKLESMFNHPWIVNFVFSVDTTFPNIPLLYLLSFFSLENDLRNLDQTIKAISFRAIRDPELVITDELHDLREDLAELRTTTSETLTYVSKDVKDFFEDLAKSSVHPPSIIQMFGNISDRATELHRFFMETFQLLMSTITIRDSQYSIRQAEESLRQTRQATILTWLAAIYLPLSVATGIFGMNLQEINGATPKWWMFILTVLGLSSLTLIFLAIPAISYRRPLRRVRRQI